MHYWNKDNFEGLLQIAEALESDPLLAPLAEYCRLRERGLRGNALQSLESFLLNAETWDTRARQRACIKILELDSRTPSAHQFLATPTLVRFIFPVLEQWYNDDPNSQLALRWIGIFRRDPEYLEKALALSPDDDPVRRKLASILLDGVDTATHHLVESRLLGDLDATKKALAEARALIESAPDQTHLKQVLEEISDYEDLMSDWEAYSTNPQGTFPQWCANQGKPRNWPTIIYYK